MEKPQAIKAKKPTNIQYFATKYSLATVKSGFKCK